jgi:hypothetical protein
VQQARTGLLLFVRYSFYPVSMPDDEKLTPADPRDVETALALALTSGKALARTQSAETMSKVVAERLVAQLKASGFVVMRRPIEGGHSQRNAPASWPHTKPDDLR